MIKIEILTLFWGDQFMEMFMRTLFRSLWLPGNIPAMLAAGCEVTHRIYCPPLEAEYLSLYQRTSKIPVEFKTDFLGENVAANRHEILFRCVQDQIRRGTLTIMAPCDHVFGDGLWSVVGGLLPGQYLVCGHPRIETERGLHVMEQFLNQPHRPGNYDLVRFCMDIVPHPMVTYGKSVVEPYWHTFNRGDYWETRFAEPPPLAFYSTPEMLEPWSKPHIFGPWEVIDHDLVDQCLARGTLRSVDDSRKFFWTEYTSRKQYLPTIKTNLQLACMRHFHQLPLRWYFKP